MKRESEVAQSGPTLSDPTDCSLSGSSVHGIFQARVLEWGAIAFSGYSEMNIPKILTEINHQINYYNLKNISQIGQYLCMCIISMCMEKAMAPPLQCSCLEGPMDGGAW